MGASINSIPWRSELFAPEESSVEVVKLSMRLVSRRGQPFLLLPQSSRHAAFGLQLYPAQRWQARAWRKILVLLLGFRVPIFGVKQTLLLSRSDPLLKFICELSGESLPFFAVMAGNPAAIGRRFVMVLWPKAKPPLVLKLGAAKGRARELLEQEEAFLNLMPVPTGMPRLVGTFRSEKTMGFALPFIEGDAPSRMTPAVAQLLKSWVKSEQRIPVFAVDAWQRLAAKCAEQPNWQRVARQFEAQSVAQTIMHGDFAPWNLRVRAGQVWALDWERGEFPGLPAWDWFHFEIQNAILVARDNNAALVHLCRTLLQRADFRSYAVAAGISGKEWALLLAYLFHVVYVVQPTEGLEQNQMLLEALCTEWCAELKSFAN